MKKIIAIITVVFIFLSGIAIAFSHKITLGKDLDTFSNEVMTLVSSSENSSKGNITPSDNSATNSTTNRLIIKSSEELDPLNAVAYVSGYKNLHVLQFSDSNDFTNAYNYYVTLDCVEFLQEDTICYADISETTSEEIVEKPEELFNPTQTQSEIFGFTALKKYLSENNISFYDNIEIAVIDSGVANDHPFLQNRVEPTGFNSIDESDDCYDDYGHGTHVAGIIAANTEENVKIKPYKVLNSKGAGTDLQVYLGIEQAVADGAEIINMSLSRKGKSSLLQEAITAAYDNGVIVVVSAGNKGVSLTEVTYSPACFDEVITVGSCTDDFYVSSFSNYGSIVDAFAPGNDINSADLNGGYVQKSGTSMSAPFVAAAVSYIKLQFPDYTFDEVKKVLYNTGKPCIAATGAPYILAEYLTREQEPSTTPFFSYSKTIFSSPFNLTISCEDTTAEIYYNTSMMPDEEYALYTEPIHIGHDMTVSAFTICAGARSSTITYTYTKKAPTDTSGFTVNSDGMLIEYTGEETDVVLPTRVNGIYLKSISPDVFNNRTDITSVACSAYITSIPAGAFENCSSLEFIRIKAVTEIGERAFYGCENLEYVVSDTLSSVGDYAFYNCKKLRIFDFSLVSQVGTSAFEGAEALKDISQHSFTSFGSKAFKDSGISSITVSSDAIIEDEAFANCPNLKYVSCNYTKNIGANSFANSTSIVGVEMAALVDLGENIFSNFENLETFSADSLTHIPENTFKNCTSLTEYSLSSVESIGDYAFYNTSITSAVFDSAVSIEENSFGNCEYLEEISFAALESINLEEFADSIAVQKISLPVVETVFNGDLQEFPGLKQIFPDISSFTAPMLTTIPANMFKNCDFVDIACYDNVETIGANAFYNCTFLTEINFPVVKSVEDYAFSNCSKMTTINMPLLNSVGAYAFSDCSGLLTVNLPVVVSIGEGSFVNCESLVDFFADEIINFDFSVLSGSESNLENISLNGITEIRHSTISPFSLTQFPKLISFSATSLASIPDGFFADCSLLTDVNIASVKAIPDDGFSGCTSMSVLNISSVEVINENTFPELTSLKTLSADAVKDFNFNYIINFSQLENISLNSIDAIEGIELSETNTFATYFPNLKSFSANKLTHMPDYAFSGCTLLTDVALNGVVTIGKAIFEGCSSIKNIQLNSLTAFPKFEDYTYSFANNATLESFEANAIILVPARFFSNCRNLRSAYFDSAVEIGNQAFYETALKDVSFNSLEVIGSNAFSWSKIENFDFTNIKSIGDYAFQRSELKQIRLENEISLGTDVFKYCSSVTDIYFTKAAGITSDDIVPTQFPLENVYWEGLTNIPDSFLNSSSSTYNNRLKTVSFPDAVTIGKLAFYKCIKIESIDMPLVTSVGISAFEYCTSLKEVHLPLVTTIKQSVFNQCYELTTLDMPLVTTVGDSAFYSCGIVVLDMPLVTSVGSNSFHGCNLLREVHLPLVENLPHAVFDDCNRLVSVDAPLVTSIGSYAFRNCKKLETINLPLVTNVGAYAFYQCTALKNVEMPKVTTVGNYAFYKCSVLENIVMPSLTSIDSYSFYGCSNFDPICIVPHIEKIESRAFQDTKLNGDVDFISLKEIGDEAFYGIELNNVTLPNVEIVNDLPVCNNIAIGSLVKEISENCADVTANVYAVPGTPVLELSETLNLGWKEFNEYNPILKNTAQHAFKLPDELSFEVIGFGVQYQWYRADKCDLSDAVAIDGADEKTFSKTLLTDPANYIFCYATSKENGNIVVMKSNAVNIIENIFSLKNNATANFSYLYTNENRLYQLPNFIEVDEDFVCKITPSYSFGNNEGYGTGSIIEILLNDECIHSFIEIMYGDVNCDGTVDVMDAALYSNFFSGFITFGNEYSAIAADFDGDGELSTDDYQAIVNKSLAI